MKKFWFLRSLVGFYSAENCGYLKFCKVSMIKELRKTLQLLKSLTQRTWTLLKVIEYKYKKIVTGNLEISHK